MTSSQENTQQPHYTVVISTILTLNTLVTSTNQTIFAYLLFTLSTTFISYASCSQSRHVSFTMIYFLSSLGLRMRTLVRLRKRFYSLFLPVKSNQAMQANTQTPFKLPSSGKFPLFLKNIFVRFFMFFSWLVALFLVNNVNG